MLVAPGPTRHLWLTTVLFLVLSALLQWDWSTARGTSIERVVLDQATVKTAA